MSSRQMCIVLLREATKFPGEVVRALLAAPPFAGRAAIEAEEAEGAMLRLLIDGRRYAIMSLPMAVPEENFARSLLQPDADAARNLIAAHGAHVSISFQGEGGSMGDAVMVAATIHLLAARIGALAAPVGAFWAESERLLPWSEFEAMAAQLPAAFAPEGAVALPARFWVSVQLSREGAAAGGATCGLLPFTGYEIELAPIPWDLADVAARLVGAVAYLFEVGPVLEDGQTLGVDAAERFRIRRAAGSETLQLELLFDPPSDGASP